MILVILWAYPFIGDAGQHCGDFVRSVAWRTELYFASFCPFTYLSASQVPVPNLIIIFGPPASGKAAIGHQLAEQLGYRFFHNHLTANPVAALFGWGIDLPEDSAFVEGLHRMFTQSGGTVHIVELLASLETRISREGTPFRAKYKPNQDDVEAARERQRDLASRYKMNTDGKLPIELPHIVVDTEKYEPAQAAAEICRLLNASIEVA